MDEQTSAGHLIAVWQDLQTPAIIRVNTRTLASQDIICSLRELGYFVARVDANRDIRTKTDLLRALADECNFPGYFGFNWDALNDCLADFSRQPAIGYVLIYEEPQRLNALYEKGFAR